MIIKDMGRQRGEVCYLPVAWSRDIVEDIGLITETTQDDLTRWDIVYVNNNCSATLECTVFGILVYTLHI